MYDLLYMIDGLVTEWNLLSNKVIYVAYFLDFFFGGFKDYSHNFFYCQHGIPTD